ncbi:MAG: alcohol dehydrogenase catalytic domain-containing protein [Spirochaetia bacterium]|nr:alcohol dehydrogenase catalytic domain-containing protein [Spirochaetia bacterium]
MKTKAVVFESPREVSFREIEVPELGEGEVLVRTRYSLISNGTESSFLRGERIGGDTPSVPGQVLPFPQVPGYQRVGVVEAIGKSVRRFKIGDTVFATMTRVSGMAMDQGGHVLRGPVLESEAHLIPPGLEEVEASGLVLSQVGYNCGSGYEAEPGEAALVIGDGLVGLWTAETLAARNFVVLLAGRHRERMSRLGFSFPHEAVDQWNLSIPKKFLSERGLASFSAVVDTVGNNETVLGMLPLLKRGGTLVSAGFLGNAGAIDIQKLRNHEATLRTPSGWTAKRLEETLRFHQLGRLRLRPYLSHTLPAENAAKAYDMILNKRENFLGILLDWRHL